MDDKNTPSPYGQSNVERQSRLPTRKAVKIAWQNIRVRWWRSLLVTSGIILALAFLMYILTADAMTRHVAERGSKTLVETLTKEGFLTELNDRDQKIQTRWMVGLALLISFVGILNAMVMSVTERFREIGTMKCLGALDSLIIKLYLLESAFQGMVGTTIGLLIGLILAYLEGLKIYGSEVFLIMPLPDLLHLIGMCALTGVVLTVLGALYPARVAARMEPVAAMRMEV
jgi:predicted lysophospholipase L1 biosynthesis ABC-type transport system permease subunit